MSGNEDLCVRPWRERAKPRVTVRVLGASLKMKREEDKEGIEASLRVCKVVPPIQHCKPMGQSHNVFASAPSFGVSV